MSVPVRLQFSTEVNPNSLGMAWFGMQISMRFVLFYCIVIYLNEDKPRQTLYTAHVCMRFKWNDASWIFKTFQIIHDCNIWTLNV